MTQSPERQSCIRDFEDHVVSAATEHDLFRGDEPIWTARAPGRLDFMGGNVDYTGGMVLESLLREAVWAAAQPRTDGVIRVFNPTAARFGWSLWIETHIDNLCSIEDLRRLCDAEESRWGRYVLGSLYFLLKFYACSHASGIDLFLASDLPPNKGVSSSAALEIATLKAASSAWDIKLEGIPLATAGQWVENVAAGAACGIMDQAAIVLGTEDHLLPIMCQPCLPYSPLRLPVGLQLWGIDSMVPRSTAGAAYETARVAAFMGYKLLCQYEGLDIVSQGASGMSRWIDPKWNGYLSNLAPSEFRSRYERWLPELLSGREFLERAGEHVDPYTNVNANTEYPIRAAVRYASEENLRVQMVHKLLEAAASTGSESIARLIGEILYQSHVAYRECGLGSEACDDLVRRGKKAGLFGAKMTGGGAGGVVALLGRSEDRKIVQAIAEDYGAVVRARPHLFEGSSEGADGFGVYALQPSLPISMR